MVAPLCFFILSVMALWVYTRRRTWFTAAWLMLILLADLAAFGHYFEWRTVTFKAEARLADPPSVTFIKAREPDLNGLRIVSHAALPYDYEYAGPYQSNYDLLDRPNVSIARGLQSVNGYDVLRLRRLAALVGELTLAAWSLMSSAFDRSAQG